MFRYFNFCIVQGFDEYMNLVLDEAEEVSIKKETRKPLGELFATLSNHSSTRLCFTFLILLFVSVMVGAGF